jgi:hypothetical protein
MQPIKYRQFELMDAGKNTPKRKPTNSKKQ